ncbi:MAG: thioredoxin family protein [Alphaproteobacteria bacterium]|nr:thioredoxin family protein [Alphaproteobacteria bacterium]
MSFTPLTRFNYHETLEQTPGPALVVITSRGCGACRAVKRALVAMREPIALFEVDAGQSPGVAAALEVFHLPAMFLYVDGAFHAPIHAEARAERLREAIHAAAAGPAQEEP